MKKNVKDHVVEEKIIQLLHNLQVNLPLVLLLLLLVLLEAPQSLSSHLQSLGLYASCHTQMCVM